MLEASFMVGAALAGVSDDMIRVLEETGKNIGYAFQIQDDILDITSTTQELGKPVHSDEKNEKNTYVTVYGMEQAKEAVEAYSEKALTFFISFGSFIRSSNSNTTNISLFFATDQCINQRI